MYLDLGGNAFNTSTTWFLENYPLDFTEVHVFEAVKDLFVIPPLQSDERRGHFIPDWQLKRIKVYNAYVGVHDKKSEEMVIFTILVTLFLLLFLSSTFLCQTLVDFFFLSPQY